jgi:4-amino-4-deoxy-L-arabinose transferase-like glycosyltransferase
VSNTGLQLRKQYAYLLLALFVVADVAMFASRAVYMDEPLFIALSRLPRDYGVFFRDTEWVFFGIRYPMFGGGSHPPAVTYYLATLYSLFGEFRNVPFRLLYSVFGVFAAFGFYGLARRLCSSPLAVTLLFLASPAFFVMAQTLMMDVPMLGLLLLGLHFYFDRESPYRPLLAALCFSLSVLSGYTALVPLACLFLSVVATRQPLSRLAPILAAPCALGLWLVAMMLYYDKNPVAPVIDYFKVVDAIAHNMIAMPSFLGGVTLFPWLFLLMRSEVQRERFRIVAASVASAILLSYFVEWKSIRYGLTFIVFASSGIGLAWIFARDAGRTLRQKWGTLELFLALWFPITTLFFVVIAQFIAARYVLLTMPALYLMLFRQSTVKTIITAVVPTLLLTLSVAIADYRFVNSYPAWVSAQVDPLQKQGFRVFSAAESGLRFYLEQRGITTLAASDLDVVGGDLIVRHSMLFKYGLSEHIETMLTVLQRDFLTDRYPIRTFSQDAGAGFHGSSFGVLPFALSRAPYDRVEIGEVNALVEKLPQVAEAGKTVPVWSPEGPALIQRVPELSYPIRLPPNAVVKYELDGIGSMELRGNVVKLRNGGAEPIVWRNFRVVPR